MASMTDQATLIILGKILEELKKINKTLETKG